MYRYVENCPPERQCCNCRAPYTGTWRGQKVCCGDCLIYGCDCYPVEPAKESVGPTLLGRWREHQDKVMLAAVRAHPELAMDKLAVLIGTSKTTLYRRLRSMGEVSRWKAGHREW